MQLKQAIFTLISLLFLSYTIAQTSLECDPKSKSERQKHDSLVQVVLDKFEKRSYESPKIKLEVYEMLLEIVGKRQAYLPNFRNLHKIYNTSADLKLMFEATYLVSLFSQENIANKMIAFYRAINRVINFYQFDKSSARDIFLVELLTTSGTKKFDDFINENFN